MNRMLDVTTSLFATLARLGGGLRVEALGDRPQKPLELYEFESCPYCRKVREVLTALDLEAVIYPCPKGGTRFRSGMRERGGKEQFPHLVDPNTGTAMYESSDIVRHLFTEYGTGSVPSAILTQMFTDGVTTARLTATSIGSSTIMAGEYKIGFLAINTANYGVTLEIE